MLHAPRRTRRATLSIFTVLAMLALALSSAAALLPSRGSAQVPPPPPVITSPISGALVGASFLVTGTGVPNTLLTIKVIRSGGVVHNTYSLTVPADGAWSLTISSPNLVLLAGFDVQASQNAPTELLSNMVHLTNSAPPPTITSPVTGATVPGGALVVSGTGVAGLAGTQVLVSSPTLGSQGAVSVLADGTWTKTFTLPNPIPVAGIDLSAKQRVLPGAYSADSNVVHVGPVVVQCLAGTYSATGNAPCTECNSWLLRPISGCDCADRVPCGPNQRYWSDRLCPDPPSRSTGTLRAHRQRGRQRAVRSRSTRFPA